MRAIAYGAAGYTGDLAHAFAAGCARHGVACEVRASDFFDGPRRCDAVWLFGLHATQAIFDAYAGLARRITGDLGYWRERACALPLPRRPVRIAIDAAQPDAHLCRRAHARVRFDALGLDVEPVRERGEYVLLAGHHATQAARHGLAYGEWEARTARRLRALTARPVVVRARPGAPPLDIAGAARCPAQDLAAALRSAWAVVCYSGNIGADAILHGVPVFAQSGPGAVYQRAPLAAIDAAEPLAPEQRLRALSDLAYWQWAPEEFESGALWEHLRNEAVV